MSDNTKAVRVYGSMGFFPAQGNIIGRNKHQQLGQAAHGPFEATRNKAENKHLPRVNFDTQMKSFSPKEISCFFKHLGLVYFRDMKERSAETL